PSGGRSCRLCGRASSQRWRQSIMTRCAQKSALSEQAVDASMKSRQFPRSRLSSMTASEKITAAPGLCLVTIAKEEGIDLIQVALRVVGGDGSEVQEIEDGAGNRHAMTDFG